MAKTNAKRRTPNSKTPKLQTPKNRPKQKKTLHAPFQMPDYKSGIGVSSRPGSESPEGESSFCAKEDHCGKGCPAYSMSSAGRKHVKGRRVYQDSNRLRQRAHGLEQIGRRTLQRVCGRLGAPGSTLRTT